MSERQSPLRHGGRLDNAERHVTRDETTALPSSQQIWLLHHVRSIFLQYLDDLVL
jgi:hypothetical protein